MKKEIRNKANNLLTNMELLDSNKENNLTLNGVWEDIRNFLKELKGGVKC